MNRNSRREKLKGKEYERALFDLHVELVKLQEWVQAQGAEDLRSL